LRIKKHTLIEGKFYDYTIERGVKKKKNTIARARRVYSTFDTVCAETASLGLPDKYSNY